MSYSSRDFVERRTWPPGDSRGGLQGPPPGEALSLAPADRPRRKSVSRAGAGKASKYVIFLAHSGRVARRGPNGGRHSSARRARAFWAVGTIAWSLDAPSERPARDFFAIEHAADPARRSRAKASAAGVENHGSDPRRKPEAARFEDGGVSGPTSFRPAPPGAGWLRSSPAHAAKGSRTRTGSGSRRRRLDIADDATVASRAG